MSSPKHGRRAAPKPSARLRTRSTRESAAARRGATPAAATAPVRRTRSADAPQALASSGVLGRRDDVRRRHDDRDERARARDHGDRLRAAGLGLRARRGLDHARAADASRSRARPSWTPWPPRATRSRPRRRPSSRRSRASAACRSSSPTRSSGPCVSSENRASGFGPRDAPCDGCSTFHDGVDFNPGNGTPGDVDRRRRGRARHRERRRARRQRRGAAQHRRRAHHELVRAHAVRLAAGRPRASASARASSSASSARPASPPARTCTSRCSAPTACASTGSPGSTSTSADRAAPASHRVGVPIRRA